MTTVTALVGRNLRIYFRDRAAVTLSLLSALILLLLYLLFLGALQADTLQERLPGTHGDDIAGFVGSWVFAGIVMISTFTTGLAALGSYVDDRSSGRFKEFRVSPIRRWQLILGYQLAAVVVATLMSTVLLLVGALLVLVLYGHFPAPLDLLRAFGLLVLLSTAFAAFSSFVLTFIGTASAYTALSTIVGTLLGFLAGAYLPLGLLSRTIGDVVNSLPFSPAAMLLREPLAGDALDRLVADVPESDRGTARAEIADYYGFDLRIGDLAIEPVWALLGLVAMAIVFTALGAWRIGRSIR